LAISPSGDTVWAAARNSDAVLAFDTSKLLTDPLHARIGSVPVGSQPVPITVLPDGKHVLVGNSNKYGDSRSTQDVTVIDIERVRASESAVVGSIRAGIFPREFGRSPDGRTLFLANFLSNTVQVIDATNVRTIEK
jgi:DNA-binding beta-propeller fold protein YncE